jgi:hypothetical protein
MQITDEINKALARIQSEDHVVHKGLREALFDAVTPVFDFDAQAFFPIRPSSATKPLRDIFYDLKNFYVPNSIPKNDFEARVKLIFQFGHLTEQLILKLCKNKFNVQDEQKRVKYGELTDRDGTIIPLTGSIDWSMRLDVSSSALTLVDSKSIGDYPFKTAPKEANIAQMQLYMHSDWGRENQVNKAILIYFNKNTSDIKCIEIDYDGGLAMNLLKRLKLAWEYYLKDEVPPREYLCGCDWEADYSPYRDYDNLEFLPSLQRTSIKVQEYAPKIGKYSKDAIRAYVEKYGNKAVNYLDELRQIDYIDGKLQLVGDSE